MMVNECRLYLITPPQISSVASFIGEVERAIMGGDVAALQIRLKQGEDEEIDIDASRELAIALKPICEAGNIALIMNDNPELCAELDLDGVHVGATDMPVKDAREIIGPDRILGATCKNSRHKAMLAAEDGADYVAFGAFYPTNTTKHARPADIETLRDWCVFSTVPAVAIGGVNPDNAKSLVEAGADFVAVVSYVWNHPKGPDIAVAELYKSFL